MFDLKLILESAKDTKDPSELSNIQVVALLLDMIICDYLGFLRESQKNMPEDEIDKGLPETLIRASVIVAKRFKFTTQSIIAFFDHAVGDISDCL
jgi:hypothetical protein